jgi:amino acid transporter
MANEGSARGKEVRSESKKLKRELTLLPLFGLIYFTVCGGSFGVEPLIGYSGPGLAILLIALTPLVFSLPNVLMVRELGSMMPAEGGYYHWVKRAFGPFAGFMAGWNNWVVSWLDVAIYPVLAATYLTFFIPVLDTGTTILGVYLSGDFLRWVVSALIIWGISYLQIRGARLSAMFTNWLGILMIIPLVILSGFGIFAWIRGGVTAQLPFMPEGESLSGALSVGLFVVMWNYMGWELPSVAGDEIINPKKTYPRAMALVLIAAILTYALPTAAGLFGGAGADGRWQLWGIEATNESVGIAGDFVDETTLTTEIDSVAAAKGIAPDEVVLDDLSGAEVTDARNMLAGWGADPAASTGWEFPDIGRAVGLKLGGEGLAQFLGVILTLAAVLSMIGLFVGNSLGGSRVPFALAEDGMFPTFMVKVHGKYGTPWVAIVLVGVVFTIFSWQAFEFLVVADVFLQTLVILAEFAAMWALRFKDPDRPRDRVPGGWLGLILVTLGPTAIILLAIISQYVEAGFASIGWALAFMAVGMILYWPIRKLIKPGVPDVDPYRTEGEHGE